MLNLSRYFKSSSLDIPFTSFIFPGGEAHIKIQPGSYDKIRIKTSLQNSNDLMTLLLATDALRGMNPDTEIDVLIPYIPYARQDRRMVRGEPLSAKVVANIINAQNYKRVTVFDPHSDVITALLDNVVTIDNTDLVQKVLDDINWTTVLVSPDAGAEKKIYKVASKFGFPNIVRAGKVRDVQTGSIVATELFGEVQNKNCLIVDDIIDGGRTFTELGAVLKKAGANKLYLVASHGIFSKGTDVFDGLYERIYISNSINKINNDLVKTIDLF